MIPVSFVLINQTALTSSTRLESRFVEPTFSTYDIDCAVQTSTPGVCLLPRGQSQQTFNDSEFQDPRRFRNYPKTCGKVGCTGRKLCFRKTSLNGSWLGGLQKDQRAVDLHVYNRSVSFYLEQCYFLIFLLGYGQTGPYRTAAGYDVIIEGEAGLMHMSVERAFLHIRKWSDVFTHAVCHAQNRRARPSASQGGRCCNGHRYWALCTWCHYGSPYITTAD